MKQRFLSYPLLLSMLFTPLTAVWAQSSDENLFRFEEVTLNGTGCPQGSAAVVLTPDAQTMSIIFDRFHSNVPQTSGRNDNDRVSDENPRGERRDNQLLDHKVCLINFLAKIPLQTQVDELEIGYDFRGHTYAERGTYTSFKSTLIEKRGMGAEVRGQKNILVDKVWNARDERRPSLEEDWIIQNTQSIDVKSRCARREERAVKIGLQNVLVAKIMNRAANNPQVPVANITLDSTDVKGRLVFRFKLKSCGHPR